MIAVLRVCSGEGAPAVPGLVIGDVDHVDPVLRSRVGVDARVVPCPLSQVAVAVGELPALAAVVGPVDAAVVIFDDGPQAAAVHRRDRDAGYAPGARGQAFAGGYVRPGLAAILAFPQGRAFAAAAQLERGAVHAPGRGIEDARVAGIDDEVDGARARVDKEDLPPCEAAIGRLVDAAFRRVLEQVAEHGCIHDVGIVGMYADTRDVAGLREAGLRPRLARVDRSPHAVPIGDVAAHGLFPAADIDDVGVRRRHFDGADRAAKISVRDIGPGLPAVCCAPYAATCRAEVIQVRLAAHAGHGGRSAAPEGTDASPVEAAQQGRVQGRCGGRRRGRGLLALRLEIHGGQDQDKEEDDANVHDGRGSIFSLQNRQRG